MPFTSQLGTALSKPGNIEFGAGALASFDISEELHFVETVLSVVPSTYTENISEQLDNWFEFVVRGALFPRNIVQIISFTQDEAAIRLPLIFDTDTNEEILLEEIKNVSQQRQQYMAESVLLNEARLRSVSFLRPANQSLNLQEAMTVERFKIANASQALAFSEVLTVVKWVPSTISETLTLSELLVRGGTFNRTISENIGVHGGMFKLLRNDLGIPYWINEAEVVKVPRRCYVVLECAPTSTAIVLPCPQMGDSEKSMHQQVVKRSMTNVLYTYVRRNDLQELAYTFVIGRPLAYDLQAFAETNITSLITLTNWKGEVWKVRITTNPLDFNSVSLYENEGEKWQVTIEFQGLRIL